jgi:hypothetical protein
MKSLGRRRRRLEDNIRMDLREMEWEVMEGIHLAQDRYHWEGFCEHGNEPSVSIKGGGFLD